MVDLAPTNRLAPPCAGPHLERHSRGNEAVAHHRMADALSET
jgi:hypothetical protein